MPRDTVAPVGNEQQAAYWRGAPGSVWAERQEKMDRELDGFGRLALDLLDVRPGERVLDIGCGAATTSLELAGRVAPGGHVVGLDFSTPQVELARRRAEANGVGNVTFVDDDAETSAISGGPFDAAFSRFGVMFFADPVAAFANVRSAVTPAGRLAFVCWQGPGANSWFTLTGRAVMGMTGVELPPPPDPEAPGPMAFADPDRIKAILSGAGWEDIVVDGHSDVLEIDPSDLDDRIRFMLGQGPLGAALIDAPEEVRQEAFVRVRALHREEGGDPEPTRPDPAAPLTHPRAVWVVTARASRREIGRP